MFDLDQAREQLEQHFDFDEVESEGSDCVRFDYGDNSVWIYRDGCTEGLATMPKTIQTFINRLGVK